jgi:2-dehydropantoate 2-reductase
VSQAAPRVAAKPGLGVVVIGAGAVGSFLGGTLAAAGCDVTLVGRRGRGADAEPTRLLIDGPEGQRTVNVRRTADASTVSGTPDVVLLAVKAFDLGGALDTAARWPRVPVVTAQNGVGAEGVAAEARTSPLIAASLTTAVEPVHGGVARRRRGGIGLAAVRGDVRKLLLTLATAFQDGGLPSIICPDATAMKWSKLLANLVGNASGALLDMDPGAIYADRDGFALERAQLREAVAVMRARGLRRVAVPGAQVDLLLAGLRLPSAIARPVMARAIGRARGGKSPSLRLHVRGAATGPTEVRWLNGAVAAAGAELGLRVPVNACLAALVDEAAADPAGAARWTGRPDLLRHAAETWSGGR